MVSTCMHEGEPLISRPPTYARITWVPARRGINVARAHPAVSGASSSSASSTVTTHTSCALSPHAASSSSSRSAPRMHASSSAAAFAIARS